MSNKTNWEVSFIDEDGAYNGDVVGKNVTLSGATSSISVTTVADTLTLVGNQIDCDGTLDIKGDDGITITAIKVLAPFLPVADPSVEDQLWIDTTAGYVIKVSQG